jgi:sulfur-oxidizing protein SoxA
MKRAALALLLAFPALAQDARRSGFDFMAPATQAMQADDAANPAMLWVADGRARFATACATCHAADAMQGVAARYPAWDAATAAPIDLAGRIQACQSRIGRADARESQGLLALEAFVALQSRGVPIAPPEDARLAPAAARGEALFTTRRGQLDLSCAQCHDDNAGRRLAGSVIPQGHATGYPIYRLEWQGVGSLQRRLRNCMVGVRSTAPAYGDADYIALELYLARRAAGMPIETPAVRP